MKGRFYSLLFNDGNAAYPATSSAENLAFGPRLGLTCGRRLNKIYVRVESRVDYEHGIGGCFWGK